MSPEQLKEWQEGISGAPEAPLSIRAIASAGQSPGVYDNLTNEQYHAGPGISKSGLWTLHRKTPEHFIGAERKETKAKEFGTACHMALLEPDLLERAYCVVPADAPRRPTEAQWKAAKPAPESVASMNWWRQWNSFNAGKQDISADDWASVCIVRDRLHADPLVKKLLRGAVFEQSAYWIDPDTGELCRCRPDIYSPELAMMADLKTCRDASEYGFAKAIDEYGYHVQEPFYADGWELAGGGNVEAFVFIAIESEKPHAFQIYELDAEDAAEGRAIYKAALARYSECRKSGIWPGYEGGVKKISRPAWARKRSAEPDCNYV